MIVKQLMPEEFSEARKRAMEEMYQERLNKSISLTLIYSRNDKRIMNGTLIRINDDSIILEKGIEQVEIFKKHILLINWSK